VTFHDNIILLKSVKSSLQHLE